MSSELSANTPLSHYRIVSKIGAGGMGEVYLAEDTRLDRKVALKLLPAQFTKDADRVRRFIQEAKAASARWGARTKLLPSCGAHRNWTRFRL